MVKKKTRDTIDSQIDAAISRTEKDLVRDTVKIRLIKEKIQMSEYVGYVMAAATVVVWVSGGNQLLYLLIAVWVAFLTWWSSLYWKLFRIKVKAERAATIRQLVEDTSKIVLKPESPKASRPVEPPPADVLQKRTFDRRRFAQIIRVEPSEDEKTRPVEASEKNTRNESSS